MKRNVLILVAILVAGYIYALNRPVIDFVMLNYNMWENEQALADLSFDIKMPGYLPNEMTMRGAVIHVIDGEHRMFSTRYLEASNTGSIDLYVSPGEIKLDSLQDKVEWTEVDVNGNTGYVGQSAEFNTIQVIWSDGGMVYQLYTHEWDEDTLLTIARSFE